MKNRLQSAKRLNEKDLCRTIRMLREKRQSGSTDVRRRYLIKRSLFELVDLMVAKEPTENEKKGRSSGSLDWRAHRGEHERSNNVRGTNWHKLKRETNNSIRFNLQFFVFNASTTETSVKQFNLRYSCAQNKYERFLDGQSDVISGIANWESCTYSWANMYRKVERDWKMTYLCRAEDADTAEIEWKFDFTKNNLTIREISLAFDTKLYENGDVVLRFISGGE